MSNSNQRSTSMAQRPAVPLAISGSFADPVKIGEVLARASREYHLVSPAPSCGSLPQGCEVAVSSVLIDVAAETYPTGGGDDDNGGGKRGLSKSALDRIASAAGISWEPELSRRLDDGRHPHYCLFKAVGNVRQFDGTTVTIVATKEMDMREGSAQVEALRTRFRNRHEKWVRGGSRGYAPRPPDGQINEMRLHLVGHAESKAKNRAIRSLGVRSSYTSAELTKPFCVARLMFTGKTSDPELRRAFAMATANRMLNGTRALYGDAPAAPSMALARPIPAPALGTARELDEDDLADLGEPVASVVVATAPAAAASAPVASVEGPQSVAAAPGGVPAEPEGFVIPAGEEKGRPLAEATDGALKHFLGRIEAAIADGVVQDSARAAAFVQAVRKELEERAVGARDAG